MCICPENVTSTGPVFVCRSRQEEAPPEDPPPPVPLGVQKFVVRPETGFKINPRKLLGGLFSNVPCGAGHIRESQVDVGPLQFVLPDGIDFPSCGATTSAENSIFNPGFGYPTGVSCRLFGQTWVPLKWTVGLQRGLSLSRLCESESSITEF